MKIWLSKNSEFPIREQLVTQITLGIASRDLKPGSKLPSTREIARRFGIHQNTVSAAYKMLAEDNLVEFRKGSGCYVREPQAADMENGSIDHLITRFLADAASRGFSLREIRDRLQQLESFEQSRYLVVESDAQLREILIVEIEGATGCRVDGISMEDLTNESVSENVRITAMFDEKEKMHAGIECTFLQANSVPDKLAGQSRPLNTELISVVSGWDRFLAFAKLFFASGWGRSRNDHSAFYFLSRLAKGLGKHVGDHQ